MSLLVDPKLQMNNVLVFNKVKKREPMRIQHLIKTPPTSENIRISTQLT